LPRDLDDARHHAVRRRSVLLRSMLDAPRQRELRRMQPPVRRGVVHGTGRACALRVRDERRLSDGSDVRERSLHMHLERSVLGGSDLRLGRDLRLLHVLNAMNLWLLTNLALASVAHAQTEPSDQEARARFQSGHYAYESGRFEEALRDFERAYELSQRPLIVYNIGLAYERLDRLSEAIRSFRMFLRLMPNAPNRGEVESRIMMLEQRRAIEHPPEESGFLFTWIGLGATVALTATTVALWIAANGVYDDLRLECGAIGCTHERIDESGGPALVTATNALLVSSLVAGAATAALFMIELLASDDESALALGVGPGSFAARLRF
jgi:tetratricopeptide (TPR) repeat protein